MDQATSLEHPAPQHCDGGDSNGDVNPSTPDPESDFTDDRTVLERLAYAVSLNYNKLATSIFYPVTRWHWYDPIRNTAVILGAVPSRHELAHLSTTHHVGHVINMCAEFPGHLETMRQLGMRQCWIPTKDFHTPSIDSLWRGVRYIEGVTENHEADAQSSLSTEGDTEQVPTKIYLHCKAGRGRSASVAICWLVYDFDLTLAQAQAILLSCRGQVDRHLYRLPEITTFYDQVQVLVQKGELKRKPWAKE